MPAGRRRAGEAPALLGLLAGASLLCAAPPSWVTAFPRDPDLYVGIGRGDKLRHPGDYREMAQSAALAQISREISVRLRSESRSARREDGGAMREAYGEDVTAVSLGDLSGYERAGVYETPEEFWVLYTLDKEAHRRALAERAGRLLARLAREAEAVEADLLAGRFQEAADRFEALERGYSGEYAADPSLRVLTAEPAERFRRLTDKVSDATRDLRLEGGEGEWRLDWRTGADSGRTGNPASTAFAPDVSAALFLSDGRGGAASGRLRVGIADARAPGPEACPAETDGQGRLDLADVALRCGLGAGEWEVTWMGPHGRALRLRKRIAVRKREVLVVLRGGGAEKAAPWLREELALLEAPGHRLVFAPEAAGIRDSLEIRLLDLSRDSLEGVHFSALRGRVRFPDGAGSAEITGKAGHGDGDRSERKAARDFARQVEARLSLPSSARAGSPGFRPARAADPPRTSPSRPAPTGWPG